MEVAAADGWNAMSNSKLSVFAGWLFYWLLPLFNGAVSISNCIASNDRKIMIHELERIRTEAAVAYFKVLLKHMPVVTEDVHEKLWPG
jgi:hypothetical protein